MNERFEVGDRVQDVVTGLKGTIEKRTFHGVNVFLDLNFRTRLYPWKGPEGVRRLRNIYEVKR